MRLKKVTTWAKGINDNVVWIQIQEIKKKIAYFSTFYNYFLMNYFSPFR